LSHDWQRDVRDFHERFDHLINDKPTDIDHRTRTLRVRLIEEKFHETFDSIILGDLEGIASSIADSMWVLLGAAVSFGIDMQPIWEEVRRANMSKSPKKDKAEEAAESTNWTAPNILGELAKQGMGEE